MLSLKLLKTQTLSPFTECYKHLLTTLHIKKSCKIFSTLTLNFKKCEVQGLTNLNILRVMKWTVSTSIWLYQLWFSYTRTVTQSKHTVSLVRKFNFTNELLVPISKHISMHEDIDCCQWHNQIREKVYLLNPLNSIRTHISELW